MKGYNVLWLPGTDHASIAVHNVIEQGLKEKGLTRESLGRDEFLKMPGMEAQIRRDHHRAAQELGCSLDWTRERFTMDEGFSRPFAWSSSACTRKA